MLFTIYTDGSSRGNPGPAEAHFVANAQRRMEPLGVRSNNFAELQAVHNAIAWALDNWLWEVEIKTDSTTVGYWLNGTVPSAMVRDREEVIAVIARIRTLREMVQVKITVIPRTENLADPGYKNGEVWARAAR